MDATRGLSKSTAFIIGVVVAVLMADQQPDFDVSLMSRLGEVGRRNEELLVVDYDALGVQARPRGDRVGRY